MGLLDALGDAAEALLPDDPVAFVKDKVIMIMNYMGYEWPSTDSGVLEGWASQWDGLQGQMDAHVDNLMAEVRNIESDNFGDIPNAVATYLKGGDSNVNTIQSIAQAAPMAAGAYRAAATLITALKGYVIGQILMDVVSIALAIISGGASAAVSFLAKKGAQLLINMAIDRAINELLGN